MSFHSNVRILSLQNARKGEDPTKPLRSESTGKMRSVVTFAPAIYLMPPLSRFVVLRVLDLVGYSCHRHDHLNLRDLGNLLHLRYLRLSGEGIRELPEEIGKLQFLQVLDLREEIEQLRLLHEDRILPSTVINLTRLMCLRISDYVLVPDGFGNLTSMEVLGRIIVDSASIVKELGNMSKLRELNIWLGSLGLEEAFVESLGKMTKIQHVEIGEGGDAVPMDLLGGCWVPPTSLQEFIMHKKAKFSTLPSWIRRNPSDMSQLYKLQIQVEEVQQEDLGFLGRLPALRILQLRSLRQRTLHIGADDFHCLTKVGLYSYSPGGIMFQPGALPKAERVLLCIGLCVAKKEAASDGGDWFDLGLGNLPSLRDIHVRFYRCGVTVEETNQAVAAVRNALRAHLNRPTFIFDFRWDVAQDVDDDDISY
ncbi:unnamed protein product [Triticum turgidum subsp. durum]|uniref:Disease resistance R13L4/SHOC-2-like LRR domain-containing protein n=1 Tax=Triticum turgidum subsp. durum TaxID=4567 RepID=A0A9R1PBP3_TRITD|nr:unnamed protein product [Triticum turgidum subsp. durum]